MPEGKPKQIGRYEIVEELGRGGFGLVYRAFDPSMNRFVAVKVLTQASKDLLTRFRNEAMVAGNLRHENLVTVFEYGTHENVPFIAMEYLEGEDLHHIITSKKPLSLLEKCNIMSQVAEGLYCAHRNGVVHRDVKPANIMVLRDGTVKIMDFGIARFMTDRDATRLTQQGYLIGTLLYMAPEQLAGSDFDALCDIFAYGVIFYELITGKHPFEAPDARSMMYKLTFEDPRPLKDFVPDVPDALQQVVSKIIQRDRELRYQSLKEVQFDTEPIRIDLQRDRAASLLLQAQDLFERKQLDPAQNVLQEALSLDPANRTARMLREQLVKQLQARTLQPRIESLLSSGEDFLNQRRFTDALQAFESALRLDRENAYIQGRIDFARGLAEHSKQAAELLAEARREFEQQNLTAAYRTASEALRHDPQNPEAAEFLKTVQSVVERRQAEQRVDDAIRKAQSLLLVPAYDEAIALLTGLGPDSDSPKVRRALELVRNEKAAQERKQRLQNEMATATDLLRDHRLEDAAQCLEKLQRDFPDNKEVAHLLAYAQKELAARARSLAVENAVSEAGALADSQKFEAALALLDKSLKNFPGETVLIRLLANTMTAKGAWERQQAVQAALTKAESLRSQKRFAEAIESLEATLQTYTSEPALIGLLEQLEAEWTMQRRIEAVRKAKEEAESLLEQKQADRAAQRLQQALLRYPGEPVLTDLLARAQDMLRAQERARAVEAICKAAAQRAEIKDFEKALSLLDQGLETWRDDEALLRQRAEVLASKGTWDRRQALNQVVTRVRELQSREQFMEALSTLATALGRYAGEPSLIELQREVERNWESYKRRQAILKAASEARLLISRGRLDEASAMLDDVLRNYPGEPELEKLSAQAREAIRARERTLAIDRAIQESQDLAASQQFERARQLVEQALGSYRGEDKLLRQLAALKEAESAWRREAAINQLLQETTQLAADNRFDDALKLLAASTLEAPSLVSARKQIESQKTEYVRRQAIASAASGAGRLLDQGRLEEAIQLLQRATSTYPGEPEWERLLARARSEVAARKRAEDIAKLTRDAQALAGKRQFREALDMLARGMATWPAETSLLTLHDSVDADRTAWEREQTIQRVLREIEALTKQRRFEKATALADRGLKEYPNLPAFVEARKQVQAEWEAHKRSEGISAAAVQARSLMAASRWSDALELLRKSCAEYPGEAELRGLLSEAEEAVRERERRDRSISEANALIAEGQLEDAVAALEPLAARFPADTEVATLLKRSRERLELKRRAEAVEKVAAEAEALLNRSDFDPALALVDRNLKNWPGETRLLEVRTAILAGKDKWLRAQALQRSIETARNLARDRRYTEAIATVEAELKINPDDQTLADLLKEFRFRVDLANARRLVQSGKPAEALEMLVKCTADKASDAEAEALMEQARTAIRTAEIDQQAREARNRAEAQDFDGALALVDDGLRKWPDAQVLRDLRQTTLNQKAAWQRQQAIRNAVARCEETESQGKLDAALQQVHKLLTEYRNEPALLALQERLKAKMAEQERRRKRERDLNELRGMQAAAVQATALSEASELLAMARRMVQKHPGDQEIQAAAADPIRHLSDIDRTQKEIANRNYDAALETCERYLAQFPNHVLFAELKGKSEWGRKVARLEELRQRASAETDLRKRAAILEEALRRYPDESGIADELRFVRNKLGLADSIVEKARACEQAGRWEDALEEWNSLLTIYDQYPGLKQEIERVQRAREKAHSEALERWAQQIEKALKTGDVTTARDLLRQALTEYPGANRLQELARQTKVIEDKKARARELLAQAQAASEKGQFAECQACLREAFQLDEFDAAFRKLVLTKLIDHAQAAIQSDWRQAETLVIEATSLQPGYAAPKQMLRTIADRKKADAIGEALAKAEQLRNSGDLNGALVEVERALSTYRDEPRLKQIKEALAAQIRKARESVKEELRQIGAAAQTATEAAQLDPLREKASAIASANRGDTEISGLATATLAGLDQRAKELRREHLRGLMVRNRRRVAIVAGAAAALAAGAFVVPRLLRGPAKIAVPLTSNVPGASVEFGKETCTTPNCDLKLIAGTYALRVTKEGYKTITRQVTVAQGQAPIDLALEPLSQLLSVNTNFESGQVYIDGSHTGDLRDGQYTASGITPGKHTIRVTGGGADFEAAWTSAVGAPPSLVQPIRAKEVQATVVANAGGSGSIACNCGTEDIRVDGASVGKTPVSAGSPAALNQLKVGTRQIAVGGRSVVVDIRPDPALNVFLNLDRNVGVLTVETHEDKVKVYLNNQLYRRTTEHGSLRIPLPVGQYSVRVEKDGFQSPAVQQVTLNKGEEKPLVFALARAAAYLEISGAVGGASVKLDGQHLGDTDASGAFRHEVAPGRHTIELTKDEYTPVQATEQFSAGKAVQLGRARLAMNRIPPKGPPPPDPKRIEAQDWGKLAPSTNPEDFDTFIKNHPGGSYTDQARARAAELRQQAQAGAARQAEQSAWDKVDPSNKAQVQEYLSHFPAGSHAETARARIADLDKKAADALAAQNLAAQNLRDQEQKKRADEQAVAKTIKDFEAAYNQMDVAALRRVWTQIPASTIAAYERQFKEAKELNFRLEPAGQPAIASAGATVACIRTLIYKAKGGGPAMTHSEKVNVTLSRDSSGWVIRSIELR